MPGYKHRAWKRALASAILWSLAASAGIGQELQRITTLNVDPVDASSSPGGFVTVPGRMYFSATDRNAPPDEPARPALYALRAGKPAAVEVAYPGGWLVAATPTVAYYLVFDGSSLGLGASFFTLWRSDGTTTGTHPVSIDGQPAQFADDPHDCAYITAVDAGTDTFLTDGCTFVQVDPVRDRVNPVVDGRGQPVFADGLARVGPMVLAFDRYISGRLYAISARSPIAHELLSGLTNNEFAAGTARAFFIEAPDAGATLWTTAGTPGSTRQVAKIPKSARALSVLGDEAYFVADQDDGSHELWQSDATAAGTHTVARIGQERSFGGVGYAGLPVALGSLVLFFVEDPRRGGVELWTTADAPDTARALKTVCSINCGFGGFELLGKIGGRALFYVGDESGGLSLWSTDGTAEGTVLVRRLCRKSCAGSSPFLAVGGLLYFGASDDAGTNQLWRSDGTEHGTFSLTGFKVGEGWDFSNGLGFFEGSIFFSGCDERHGCELWKSDGSPGAAVLAQNLNTTALEPPGAMPTLFSQISSGIVFSACDHGVRSLWSLPRGSEQPHELAALPQACAVDVNADDRFEVASAGDFALFALNGNAVWRTDGRPSGTFLLASFAGQFVPVSMTRVGSEVWFLACLDSGLELWRSDGSPAGTVRFASLPDQTACAGEELAAAGKRLFFQLGNDLWTSDGTQQGTLRLASPPASSNDGSGPSFRRFVPFGSGLIFSADDGSCTECGTTWRSDGTPAGTREIEHRGFVEAAVIEQRLYLLALDGLWRTNGEPGAARRIVDFSMLTVPGSAEFFWCSRFAVLQRQFYFSLSTRNSRFSCALDRSDGTQGGTQFLGAVDLSSEIFALGDRLFFVGAEPFTQDTQLWQTNGTQPGTRVVDALNALSPNGAQPVILGTTADGLFFSADDGLVGRQLYRVHF